MRSPALGFLPGIYAGIVSIIPSAFPPDPSRGGLHPIRYPISNRCQPPIQGASGSDEPTFTPATLSIYLMEVFMTAGSFSPHGIRLASLAIVCMVVAWLPLSAGSRGSSSGLPAPRSGGDTITKVYSMIHFGADSARMTPVQQRILKEYVFDGILSERNPVIDVIGYTDVMGTPEHNLRLSLRRAESVAGAIRKGIASNHYRSLTARGVGENQTRFTNDLPEGRFYNRTVRVLVTSAKE